MAALEPVQSIAHMLSGSVQTYRRNFGNLYWMFLASLLAAMLPVFLNLDVYITQLHQTVLNLDSTPIFTVAYILMPLLKKGFLVWQIAAVWTIAVFATPFFMGMASIMVSEDTNSRKCTLAEAARSTLGNYKHLLSVYMLYYTVLTVFSVSSLALFYWLIKVAPRIISEVWLYPVIVMFSVGAVVLLLGTIFILFVVLEDHKGAFRAYAGSFKAMYSRNFGHNIPGLLIAAVIAGAIAFAAMLPVTLPVLTGNQADALMYFGEINNDFIFIVVLSVVIAFVGAFLFIFAYNTYRKAGKAISRRKNVNTYRRKIEFVQSMYRRRIG